MSENRYVFQKSCCVLFIIVSVIWSSRACAADLPDLYQPFVPGKKFLYQAEVSSFDMVEKGLHGSASFSDFKSDPSLLSLSHSLKFSPIRNFQIEAGYGQFLPRKYTRLTYDGPTPALDTEQEYTLQHFQDYFIDLRLRKETVETYLTFREKRQKAKADAVLYLDNTVSYDDIFSHYEDLKCGIRYLSEERASSPGDDYFQAVQPLLEKHQVNVEAGLGFKNGRVKNTSDIYLSSTLYIREYFHQLRPHFIPEIFLRYGLSDQMQVETGLAYTTPFKYNYEYKQFNPATSNFITGTYSIKNDIKAPLKVSYRPSGNLSVGLSSDFQYVRQRLDMWEKETDDSITAYRPRNLRALIAKPTLEMAYFHDAGRGISKDEFSFLTKRMLKEKQFLWNFQYQKNITSLKKDDNNGVQNVIDPYSLFLYPLDLFVSGSEYGTFFLGNKTTRAAEVSPQNYYLLETTLVYGLRDNFNVGMGIGYRSGSSLHHFTLQDLADRFYKFEPFHYFHVLMDWKVRENSLLSLKASYVPQYKTFLDTNIHPGQFETETRYCGVSLAWKILF